MVLEEGRDAERSVELDGENGCLSKSAQLVVRSPANERHQKAVGPSLIDGLASRGRIINITRFHYQVVFLHFFVNVFLQSLGWIIESIIFARNYLRTTERARI